MRSKQIEETMNETYLPGYKYISHALRGFCVTDTLALRAPM